MRTTSIFRNRRGFSLLEVIVASAIFVTVFVVLVQIFPFQKRSVVRSERSTVATQLAQGELEKYSSLSYDPDLKSKVDAGTPIISQATENNTLFEKKATFSYVDKDLVGVGSDGGLIKITVEVTFTQNSQPQTVKLSKVVYKLQ